MPIARQAKTRGFRVGLAYNRLREMIVWGTLSPGMRLVESELMTQLGLGRTPIRTALHRLQSEGFVVGTGKGKESLRVSPLTHADAADVFEIVGALESIAIRRAGHDWTGARALALATKRPQKRNAGAHAGGAGPRASESARRDLRPGRRDSTACSCAAPARGRAWRGSWCTMKAAGRAVHAALYPGLRRHAPVDRAARPDGPGDPRG